MLETSSDLPQQAWEIVDLSSEIFGKCSEAFVRHSDSFWRIFGNLRKIVQNVDISVFI